MNFRSSLVVMFSLAVTGLFVTARADDTAPATTPPATTAPAPATPAPKAHKKSSHHNAVARDRLHGKIDSFDSAKNTLTIKVGSNPVSFVVNQDTKIRKGKKAVANDTLTADTPVTVYFARDNGQLTAKEILIRSKSSSSEK